MSGWACVWFTECEGCGSVDRGSMSPGLLWKSAHVVSPPDMLGAKEATWLSANQTFSHFSSKENSDTRNINPWTDNTLLSVNYSQSQPSGPSSGSESPVKSSPRVSPIRSDPFLSKATALIARHSPWQLVTVLKYLHCVEEGLEERWFWKWTFAAMWRWAQFW